VVKGFQYCMACGEQPKSMSLLCCGQFSERVMRCSRPDKCAQDLPAAHNFDEIAHREKVSDVTRVWIEGPDLLRNYVRSSTQQQHNL
jgi:hypothetical protein